LPNPLSELCKQLGIGTDTAANLADIDPDMASAVLMGQPPVEVDAYLRLAAAVGVRLKFAAAPPLSLWFDLPYLDGLCFDNEFRERVGLLPLPATTVEVRNLVLRLANDMGPSAVCKALEDSMVPTSQGVRHWNRGTVPQYTRCEITNDTPLERPAWLAPAWRTWLVGQITDQWCRYDPMAFVRYSFRWTIRDGLLLARSADKMPAKPREWIVESLTSIEWIAGRWGISND